MLYSQKMRMNIRLKQLRQHYGLSGEKLAGIVGLTKGRISQIESGDGELSAEQIRRLRAEIAFSCDWLIDGSGSPPWEINESLKALYAVAEKLPSYAVTRLTQEGSSYAKLIEQAVKNKERG